MAFFNKSLSVRLQDADWHRLDVALEKNPDIGSTGEYIRGAIIQRLNKDVPRSEWIAQEGDEE